MGVTDWSVVLAMATSCMLYPGAQAFQAHQQYLADNYVAQNYMLLPTQKAGVAGWSAMLCEHGAKLQVTFPVGSEVGDVSYLCVRQASTPYRSTAVRAER